MTHGAYRGGGDGMDALTIGIIVAALIAVFLWLGTLEGSDAAFSSPTSDKAG